MDTGVRWFTRPRACFGRDFSFALSVILQHPSVPKYEKEAAKDMPRSYIDFAELLSRTENDRELLLELLSIFKEEFPQRRRALGRAVASQDARQVAMEAHALKGMLANLAAREAAEAAARLELLGRQGKSAEFRESLAAFDNIAEELLLQLDAGMAEVSG